ncbi:MAG: hypothetical protein ACE5FB_09405 [Candidatus Binatia bacterium]
MLSGLITRKRIIILAVVLGVLGLSHFGWFSFFGPPALWGSGVAEKVPKFAENNIPASVLLYAEEMMTQADVLSREDVLAGSKSGVLGEPFHYDIATEYGLAVIQTHAGKYWGDDQHLYIRSLSSTDWRELPVPKQMKMQDATIVRLKGEMSILLARWYSWWPHSEQYGRFLRSIFRKELRAEYGVYLLGVDRNGPEYVFPGHSLVPSPGRRHVAYLASTNGFSGFHSLLIYSVETGRSKRLFSLLEADPGSGVSFRYRWSRDSQALLIAGSTQGFTRFGPKQYRSLRMVYLVDSEQLYDFAAQQANNK